jgi:ribonuclease BN (tRNA processing enzyme)
MRRAKPFPVYGPRGLQRMTNHLLAAFAEDIEIRTSGLEHEVPGGYRVKFKRSGPASFMKRMAYALRRLPCTRTWKQAFGYRIDTPDRSIVISGDTRPSEALVKAAQGVDVLIHEVYSAAGLKPEDRPEAKIGLSIVASFTRRMSSWVFWRRVFNQRF